MALFFFKVDLIFFAKYMMLISFNTHVMSLTTGSLYNFILLMHSAERKIDTPDGLSEYYVKKKQHTLDISQ